MVITESTHHPYVTIVRHGSHAIQADAPIEKGGGGEGFGAHALLEAAIATCINMAVRMYANAHGIPLEGASCRVEVLKPNPATTRFEYQLRVDGDLTPAQRESLHNAARTCPVSRTLSRRIEFAEVEKSKS